MGAYAKFRRDLPTSVTQAIVGNSDPESADLWVSFREAVGSAGFRRTTVATSRLEKDLAAAEKHRKQGVEAFENGKYSEALSHHNAAVRLSPVSSITLGLTYANRSAVLFMQNNGKMSIADMDRALSLSLPEQMKDMIMNRRQRCQAALKIDSGSSWSRWLLSMITSTSRQAGKLRRKVRNPDLMTSTPKSGSPRGAGSKEGNSQHLLSSLGMENRRISEVLKDGPMPSALHDTATATDFGTMSSSHEGHHQPHMLSDDICLDGTDSLFTGRRNAVIPAAAEALTMHYAPDKGRFYVANRDIEPGEFVLNEKPYASALYASLWETHCQTCMRPAMAPLPCDSCAAVVFCSSNCKDVAKATFHTIECPHMGDLAEFAVRDGSILPLRMMTRKNLEYFRSRLDALHRIDKQRNKSVMSMPLMHVNSDEYLNVFNLLPHLGLREKYALSNAAALALFFTKCLVSSGYFGATPKLEDTAMISRLMFHNLMAFECNYFTLSQSGITEDHAYVDLDERGMAVFCGASMFNHSCNPNVTHYFLEDNIFCRANGVIAKGQEVNISYGQYFHLADREYRRSHLKESYYFYPCSCDACEENWPLMEDIVPPARYQCPKCKLSIELESLEEISTKSCSKCNTSFQPYVEALQQLKRDAENFVTEVHSGKLKRISDAIVALGNYQKALWSMSLRPNADYIMLGSVLGEFFVMESLPMLSPKQLCAVESAALHHSNRPVVVAVNNEFLQLPFFVDIWSEIYPNIAFTRLEIQNWLNGTVLESWLSKHLLDSSGYKTIHTSDVLRYATLFKYGGLYLDTDVIVIKSMTDLVNALGIESNDLINGAVMAFVKHHPVMKCCLMDILSKCVCAFYPVHYTEWPRLIHSDVDISAKALKETEESYLVHYWGRLSVDEAIQLNTPQALALLARKHCPKVSAAMTDGKLWGFNVLPVGQF
ncbi:unnamed protein product [Notodromas monacha]|uniref:Protein-lysine N-methyltransferase SMYD4 n=1 Tax=Notodromas monacha TaxID=399045 RepID=A0A7R9GFZ1_9CRUS|nr:unnamed protein product [Notodromas monacha]CAG0919642.1 unnamed protein product [Notodromas monacha]